MHYLPASALAAALAVSAVACSDSPSAPTLSDGNFNLRLRDTPFTDAKAVLVTFSTVRAHRADSDWTVVPFVNDTSSRTCDLKKLETTEEVLGSAVLPTGHYTQVTLVVQSATLYFDNASTGSACASSMAPPVGASATLEIPSGQVTLTRAFDVSASSSVITMLIDFDGNASIHLTGNGSYTMSPVITVLSVS